VPSHVLDTQVHIWEASSSERPWPPGREAEAHRPEPVTAEVVRGEMDAAGVDRTILVPPSWEGDRNDLVLEATRRFPDRFAAMGRIALDRPDVRAQIAALVDEPGILGLRLTFHLERYRRWLDEGAVDPVWAEAERLALPVMVAAPGALAVLDRVAGRHPDLRLILDHAGLPPHPRGPAALVDLPQVCALARHPGVAVKLSGLPCLSLEAYPYRDLHDAIHALIDAYGPGRAFWGSDLTRAPCGYRACVTMFTEELPWLHGRDLASVMGGAAARWLGWPVDAARTVSRRT
jgi:predicted TIM-barrel fold metal-dependent hydrolase